MNVAFRYFAHSVCDERPLHISVLLLAIRANTDVTSDAVASSA